MRKIIIPLILIGIVGCNSFKDEYETAKIEINDLQQMVSELSEAAQVSQATIDTLQDRLQTALSFTNVDAQVETTIREAVASIALSIALDAHTILEHPISLENFSLTFVDYGGDNCGLGDFCRDDIPIEIDVLCWQNLTPLRQYELVLHEFGHSYFDYLHHDEEDRQEVGIPPTVIDTLYPYDLMHSVNWIDDMEHLRWAKNKFWNINANWIFNQCPPTTKGGLAFYCR